MKQSLALTSIFEAATGLVLIIAPSLVGWLLFGAEFTGVATPAARVTGIALLALGVGCFPCSTAFCGMLTYSALVTLYLLCLAIRGEWIGPLLWPVVVLHGILTLLLAWAWFWISKARTVRRTDEKIIETNCVTRTVDVTTSEECSPKVL
jgi:hypothetical protein